MGQEFGKPVGVTASNGYQIAVVRPSQGLVVSDDTGLDLLTVGYYGQQRNLGMVLNDGTDNRMIIGFLPDGTIGIAISKDGEDVFDAFS